MTATVRKAYRLPVDLADELASRAEADGITATETVIRALTAYLRGTDSGAHGEAHAGSREAYGEAHADDGALAALTAQLAVKDAQIARLMDSLDRAQESVRAAQVLEGAHVARLAASGEPGAVTVAGGAEGGEPERTGGVLARLARRVRGRRR